MHARAGTAPLVHTRLFPHPRNGPGRQVGGVMRGHPCSHPGVQAHRGLSPSINPRPPLQGSVACYRDTRGLPRETPRPQLPADLRGEQALVAASRGPPHHLGFSFPAAGWEPSATVLGPSRLRASQEWGEGGERGAFPPRSLRFQRLPSPSGEPGLSPGR